MSVKIVKIRHDDPSMMYKTIWHEKEQTYDVSLDGHSVSELEINVLYWCTRDITGYCTKLDDGNVYCVVYRDRKNIRRYDLLLRDLELQGIPYMEIFRILAL